MPDKIKRYESWGRYPRAGHARVVTIKGRDETLPFAEYKQPVLAYAQGRSYGDTCLNNGGILIDTTSLSSTIMFDRERGLLRCEAGATLSDILQLIVPQGWFLPVTPGTKHVSVGGAIAHDVHGKNHHRAGTFGCHLKQFELLRSSGERFLCSSLENAELYRASIAGLGLTGLIVWAEIQLQAIAGPLIDIERIPFASLEEFITLAASSDQNYEYTVAWMDSFAPGRKFGRGIFTRGNHAKTKSSSSQSRKGTRGQRIPFRPPSAFLNPVTAGAFNKLYYHLQSFSAATQRIHYEPYFYALDAVSDWNRMYGPRGFLQYQNVIPYDERDAWPEIFTRIRRSGLAPFLAVLKTFGPVASPGMLSFPRPGITLALDFPNRGPETLRLLDELDEVTRAARGAVYPAKDARMSAPTFQTYFPQWQDFARFIDPQFSSSFWRRVTASENKG